MIKFVGSPNSRFFVGVRGDQIFYAKEDTIAWEKQIPFESFQVVAIGGNGNVFLRAPEGIYVFDSGGRDVHTPIARWSSKALAATSSQLAGVRVSADGRTLCVERSTLQTRMSQKIFEFLSSKKVEANTTIHEIFFHNISEDSEKQFYRCMSSTKSTQKFLWDISIDFMWIVLAEPEKNGAQIRFSVAHVPSQTIYHEFAIPNIQINALKVSREGTALVDVSQGGERAIIIVTLDSVKYHLTVPSMDYTVRHIGKAFVAIQTHTTPFLLVKGFDDRLLSQADLRPLQRLGIEHDVSFNERDALDLISMANNRFKVVHTNVEFLETDARRWEQIADTVDAEREAELNPPPPKAPAVQRPTKLDVEVSRPTMQPMIGVDGLAPGVPQAEAPLIDPSNYYADYGYPEERPRFPGAPAGTPPGEAARYPGTRSGAGTPPIDTGERRRNERRAADRRQAAPPPPPPPPRREPLTHIPLPGRDADNGTGRPPSLPAATPTQKYIPPPSKPSTPAPAEPKAAPAPAPAPPDKNLPSAGRSRTRATSSGGRSRTRAAASPPPATPPTPPEAVLPPPRAAAPPLRPAAPPPRSAPPAETPTVAVSKSAFVPPAVAARAAASAAPLDDNERRRIQRLLELLEERFVLGQVSETTYAELKAKYTTRLGIK